MPAYLIAEIKVTDPETYARYRAQASAVCATYDGRYLVRGGATEAKEGAPPAGRVGVIEFCDMVAARRFYDSPEYQAILPLRRTASRGRLYLVEGSDPAPRRAGKMD